VVGVYMKNWTQDIAGVACPWQQDLADARAAAAVLDIPFKVFDFQAEYKQHVVDVMVAEYQAGRTPTQTSSATKKLNSIYFCAPPWPMAPTSLLPATTPAAQDGQLHIPTDTAKDQTYFLYRVSAQALRRTIFPLAGLTKPAVRTLAAKFGLPTAKKPDSQAFALWGEVGPPRIFAPIRPRPARSGSPSGHRRHAWRQRGHWHAPGRPLLHPRPAPRTWASAAAHPTTSRAKISPPIPCTLPPTPPTWSYPAITLRSKTCIGSTTPRLRTPLITSACVTGASLFRALSAPPSARLTPPPRRPSNRPPTPPPPDSGNRVSNQSAHLTVQLTRLERAITPANPPSSTTPTAACWVAVLWLS